MPGAEAPKRCGVPRGDSQHPLASFAYFAMGQSMDGVWGVSAHTRANEGSKMSFVKRLRRAYLCLSKPTHGVLHPKPRRYFPHRGKVPKGRQGLCPLNPCPGRAQSAKPGSISSEKKTGSCLVANTISQFFHCTERRKRHVRTIYFVQGYAQQAFPYRKSE